MNSFTGLDIKKIYTIVFKEETNEFYYENSSRAYDGFVLITKGEGTVVDKNSEIISLKPGDVILLRKGESYSIHFPMPCSYITSGYDLEFDSGTDFPVSLPSVVSCSKSRIELMNELYRIWQTRSWDAYTRCRIMLLDFYIREIKKQMKALPSDNAIKSAKEFIHENFRRNFSGSEIAKHCNMSLSYLRSKFLSETGYTINGYRDSLRYDTAREMLESRIFSVTEIALELGFCDVYHFSKFFKRISKLPPTEYLNSI